MQFKPIALLALAVASVNGAAHFDKRSGTCNCGHASYSGAQTAATINHGMYNPAGGYPHQFFNYEGFSFPCSGRGPWYEFPLIPGGGLFTGGNPGADRVVFLQNGVFCGCVTHYGAKGNAFNLCR